jgi:ubiquinone/menaquinone biosynthesis C-methylase UbiE
MSDSATAGDAGLPDYEPMLAAYHRAFASELRAIVGSLPIAAGASALDMACGDGAYSLWLAERVGPAGRVVAVDSNPRYLEIARREWARGAASEPGSVEFLCAPIESLPFDEGTFDVCFCAQSLYSLPDPVEAIRALLRVTKPGGTIAVLENDTLHHVILPWPIEVELSVRAHELKVLAAESDRPHKFYVGRALRSVFRQAGMEQIGVRTFAYDRCWPLGPDERVYFTEHLKELSGSLARHLDGPTRRRFELMADPQSDDFLLNDPDLTVTCIDQLAWGRKAR